MTNITPVDNWLSQMAFSHSNSENTKISYKYYFKKFEDFAETTAEQIIADYEKLDDKQFKRKYTPIIMSYVGKIQAENFSPSSQSIALSTVKSFFKYMSLPLNFLPSGRRYVVFHNRDITKEEIEAIIKDAQPREKAYYSLMTQSGLRPNEISNLKIGDIENLLEKNTSIPCLITIRQEATKGKYKPYFTFVGQETITYIEDYFKREKRDELTPEDYLFTKDDGKTKTDSDLISHIFRRTVEKLKGQKVLNFENKKERKANRNEIRLYNLRKYFRNHAGQAGTDYVNFWMGHSLGIDEHYFSQTDITSHRKQYLEKAMPNLRIETKTPDQNEQTISDLQNKITEREKENRELKNQIDNQQIQINKIADLLKRLLNGDVASIEPIPEENALNQLITTPEDQQIDLTPNQANFKLRRKLIIEKYGNNGRKS
jgi:integrase